MIPADVLSKQLGNRLLLGLCWLSLILILTVSLRLLRRQKDLSWPQLISLLLVLAAPVLIYFQFTFLLAFVEQNWIHASLALLIPVSLLLVVIYGVAVFIVIRFLRSPGRAARRKLTACSLVLLITLLTVPAGAEVIRATLNPEELQTWFGREISVADANPFQALAAWNKQSQKQLPAWIWIYPQWTARHGEGFAVLLSLSILLIWSLLRWSRSSNDQQPGSADDNSRPSNWRAGVRLLRRSSLIALLVVTLVYLAALPSLIKAENRDHRKRYQALSDPFAPLQQVDQIKAEIKNDRALMRSFEEQIQEIQQRLVEEVKQMNHRTTEAPPE